MVRLDTLSVEMCISLKLSLTLHHFPRPTDQIHQIHQIHHIGHHLDLGLTCRDEVLCRTCSTDPTRKLTRPT